MVIAMAKKSISQINVPFNGLSFLLDIADGNLMSLNAIYAAAGSPSFRESSRWLTTDEAIRFIGELCNSYNTVREGLIKVTRGKGGGTWAHWKIATKYAAYLNPAIESAILDVFQERVQEEIDPELAFTRGRERAVAGWERQGRNADWISTRINTIDTWKSFTNVAKEHGVEKAGYAKCADAFNVPLLGGTANAVRQARGITTLNLRDSLDEEELAEIELAQIRAKKKIVKDEVRGNKPCAQVCLDVSTRIAGSR